MMHHLRHFGLRWGLRTAVVAASIALGIALERRPKASPQLRFAHPGCSSERDAHDRVLVPFRLEASA